MKLYILKLLQDKLKDAVFIKVATRIDNNTIKIIFDKDKAYYFNLNKQKSFIYKKDSEDELSKIYNAPFDLNLHKIFSGSTLDKIEVLPSDRIIKFFCTKKFSYKIKKSILQLEFTGKRTNAILLDENLKIIEALRHISSSKSFRAVEVGGFLKDLKPFEIKEIKDDIKDLDEYFKLEYFNFFKKDLDYKKSLSILKIDKNINKTQLILDNISEDNNKLEDSKKLYDRANIVLRYLDKIDIYKTVNIIEENKIIIDGKYKNKEDFVNSLFTRAKKNKAKVKNSILQIDNLQEKIDFFKKQKELINNAKNIDSYLRYIPNKKNTTKANYEVFLYQGFRILLGKNSAENISVLKNSKNNDLWFHLQGKPSSHVIIRIESKKPKEDVLIMAGKYCVDFSVNSKGRYLVDYTQRKNVNTISGSKVAYSKYKTLVIIKD